MATLQKIRDHGVFLLIIVGIAMMAFVLGDLLNSGSQFFNRGAENVGEINGRGLHYTDYEREREQLTEVYKLEYGQVDFNEDTYATIRNQVWQAFVLENLLSRETDKIGLFLTPTTLTDACIGQNPHALLRQRRLFADEDGNFSPRQVIRFLSYIETEPQNDQQAEQIQQFRTYWEYWERTIKNTILQERYLELFSALSTANNIDAKYEVSANYVKRDVRYVLQPYYALPDSLVQVSDSDIKQLYTERKKFYAQQPHRDLQFVSFPILPSEEDDAQAKKFIEDLLEEFTNSTDVVALVNANSETRYIDASLSKDNVPALYKDFAFGPKAKKDLVSDVQYADGVYSVARIVECGYSRSDSVHLATLDSAGGISRDLGWYDETRIQRNLIDSAFLHNVGFIFSVPDGAGVQRVKILAKSTPTPKVKIAILSRSVSPSSKTYASVYNTAKIFASKVQDIASFRDTARAYDIPVLPAYNVVKSQEKVNNIASSRPIVRWAFGAKQGQVSDVFECENQYIVANVVNVSEDKYRSLSEVRSELQSLAADKKKGAYMSEQLRGVNTLEQAAAQLDTEVESAQNVSFANNRFGNSGIEPAVVGKAMSLPLNEMSEPIAGNLGIYLLQPIKQEGNTEVNIDVYEQINRMNRMNAYQNAFRAMNYLTECSEIVDNRGNF